MASVTGFLLTRHWRDGPDGVELVFWAHSAVGPLRLVFTGQRAVCFRPADTVLDPADRAGLRLERKRLRLRALDGRPVDGLYLTHQRDLGRLRAHAPEVGVPLYESDVKPHDRFLMERFITASLEVRGEAVERGGYLEFHNPGVRPAACDPRLVYVSLGIETDGIDGEILSIALCNKDAEMICMQGEAAHWESDLPIRWYGDEAALLEGFLDAFRALDPDLLLGWNLINFDLDYLQRAVMTGLLLGRQGGSVAAFDNLYLPRLHRAGAVAPDVGASQATESSPGGYVMDSQPGLYDNVLVLDFKSLYPSIIRTFHIDPLGLARPGEDPVPGFLGAETGSKKRYAGTVRDAEGELALVFKGLESVRSDWTPLAQSFQRELYRRVFLREPWESFVRETVAQLKSGALDDQLVYRKRLRQPLDAYRRNVPPHVQASRKLANPGRVVRYLITVNGPEPVSARTSRIDYQHYLDRQLAPIADGILLFLGNSYARLTETQLELFAPKRATAPPGIEVRPSSGRYLHRGFGHSLRRTRALMNAA